MTDTRLLVVPLLFLALALSGCVEDASADEEDVADPLVVRIPMGAGSPDYDGPAFVVDQPAPANPTQMAWINGDAVMHSIMVMDAQASASAGDHQDHQDHEGAGAEADDGHSDHDHGGSASATVDEESGLRLMAMLGPGQSVTIPLMSPGDVTAHCMHHDWLQTDWQIGADGVPGPRPYPVVVTQETFLANTSGDNLQGEVDLQEWDASSFVNIASVDVLLVWDDSKDDTATLEQSNAADTFTLRLFEPNGTLVAETTGTQRNGSLILSHTLPVPGWPSSILANDIGTAEDVLAAEYPDDLTGAGMWRTEVELVSAPGIYPEGQEPASEAPGADGHQEWDLTVRINHQSAMVTTGTQDAGGHGHAGHTH